MCPRRLDLKCCVFQAFCGKVRLEQVIALETDFGLLTRVWCVAELVEANELHLQQAVSLHRSFGNALRPSSGLTRFSALPAGCENSLGVLARCLLGYAGPAGREKCRSIVSSRQGHVVKANT